MKTIIDRFGILAFVCMAIVFLLSSLVLLGWLFIDGPIKELFPGQQLSNPVTALCFFFSAYSFALINSVNKPVRKKGKVIALLIAIVGALKFSETLFSFHSGIDSWFFSTKLMLNQFDGKPNFMAPNTAVSFLIMGLALALSRYKMKRKNVVADYFAMAVLLIAAISIIGYLYQAMEFYHAKHYVPMAFPTALCFLFISLAVLFRRSEFGFFSLFTTKYQGSITARYLVPFAILIPLGTGLLGFYAEQVGLLSASLGLAVYAVCNIILFLFVIWLSVLSINKASRALEAEVEVRRVAEQNIFENQQLLMDLYDNAPVGYYSLDENGVFIKVSLTTLNWLGYSREELIGKSVKEILDTEGADKFDTLFEVFKQKGVAKDLEFTLRRKDGSTFPVLVNGSAVRDENGRFLYSRSTIFDITERKISEKTLSDNENRLKSFFNAGPDAIIVINDKQEILEWNPKAESIFGYKAEEVEGRILADLIVPAHQKASHQRGMNGFLRTSDKHALNKTIEITALHKDGHEFYISTSISTLKLGEERMFIAFISDITERKRLEEEIRQSNIFLNSILENIPHMVFVKDAKDLRFVRFNKAGEKIIGIKKSELIGKNDYDFFTKEKADTFTSMDREVLKSQTMLDIKEEIIQTPVGDRWLHTKKIPLLDDKGLPVYLLGVSEDITEQKKLQSILKESNKKFLSLFYNSPLAMIITDLGDGKIMDVNEEYERLFGFAKNELIGRNSVEVGLTTSTQLGNVIRKKIAEVNSVKNLETIVFNSRKQPVDVIISVESIRIEKKDCLIAALIDNTERKRLEEDLLHLNQELESFTYSVSHDLRAPLRIVNGYAEIIKDEASTSMPADSLRMLDNIIQSAKQMGTLIDDLLNFSKLGRRELITHTTNMRSIIDSVLRAQLNGESKYNVVIGDLPECCCDSSLVKQVWENLISNAIKYSANKPQPEIEIGSQLENGKIIYYIKDRGAGFDMKYYDKLFAVFQRLHKASEFEGTGVGLALSQRIIAKHGGKIWAESTLHKGSTFYFTVCK